MYLLYVIFFHWVTVCFKNLSSTLANVSLLASLVESNVLYPSIADDFATCNNNAIFCYSLLFPGPVAIKYSLNSYLNLLQCSARLPVSMSSFGCHIDSILLNHNHLFAQLNSSLLSLTS